MEKALKIICALLLVLSVFSHNTDFKTLVGFVVVVAFGILAYNSHVNRKLLEVFMYLGLIIVFQPFYSYPIATVYWQIISCVLAIGLLLSLVKLPFSQQQK